MSILENFGNAEIAKLDSVVARQENILRFDISVKHSPTVDVFQWKTQLDEPIHYLSFSVELVFGSSSFDMECEIADCNVQHIIMITFTEFHNDKKHAVFYETPFIPDYVGMRQVFQ